MKRKPPDRTGVFIVRLWIEPDHEKPLRARITQTLDTMVPERSAAVAASADDICAGVKQWVDDFMDTDTRKGSRTATVAVAEGGS